MCYHPEHGCEQLSHHAPYRGWHHHQDCCSPGHPLRRFPTREELVQELEEYLKQLTAEAKGVEERIAELRKES